MKFSLILCIILHRLLLLIQGKGDECQLIDLNDRLDCYPESNASPDKCHQRHCCWDDRTVNNQIPYCFFPKDYSKYHVEKMHGQNDRYQNYTLTKKPGKSFSNSANRNEFSRAFMMIHHETEHRLRLKISDHSKERWEPKLDYAQPEKEIPGKSFNASVIRDPFGLIITSDDRKLIEISDYLTTGLILSDQMLQVTFKLNASHIYGLGEHRDSLSLSLKDNWQRIPFWSRDQPPIPKGNLYGVHNFLIAMSEDGKSFGIFFLNSNAHEVVIQPNGILTYRTNGGILDFFFFPGPNPIDVIQEYHRLIGFTQMPPKWAFGYHLSRFGYSGTREAQRVYQRNKLAGVDLAAFWIDIDYMHDYKDWTLDEIAFQGYDDFINNVVRASMKTRHVIIVDPAIRIDANYNIYKEAVRLGIFINDSITQRPIIGKVWPGETNFPDFSHPAAYDWWYKSASDFNKTLKFDGLWIDMNEPSSFYDGSSFGCDANNLLDNPLYTPPVLDGKLYSKTICPSSLHHDTTHYNKHNLYGYYEAKVTQRVLERMNPNERPFILTRASFAGSGQFTNHWTGDNFARWEDLASSLRQVINFNMFGIPMTGSDVCGFLEDTQDELCVRWHQMAAYQPFFRNHNTKGARDQDPASFSPETLARIKVSLAIRKLMIPTLYSLLYDAHLNGLPAVNAMAFIFPEDKQTHHIQSQFMLGKCILVSPVIEERQTFIETYLPKGYWFSTEKHEMIFSNGSFINTTVKADAIQTFTKGGCVQFWPISRYGYVVMIFLSQPDNGNAMGHLYFDDDRRNANILKVTIKAENGMVEILPTMISGNYNPLSEEKIADIYIYNVNKRPKKVWINGQKSFEFIHEQDEIHLEKLFLNSNNYNVIKWT